jgi:hypothetical protein
MKTGLELMVETMIGNRKRVTYQRLDAPVVLNKPAYVSGVKGHHNPRIVGNHIVTSDVMFYDPKSGLIITRYTAYNLEASCQ